MKTWTLALTLAAGIAVATVATAAPLDDPRSYCAASFPRDYTMQLTCVRMENRARVEVGRWAYAEPEVYAHCYYAYDSWTMIATCGTSELGARRTLQRMGPVTPPGCVDYGKTRVCG